MITVNIFFAHWIKEISITKYGTNKELTPTSTPQEIYQYSDSMLKYLPEKSLNVIQNELLYSQKPVLIPYSFDRRVHGSLKNSSNQFIFNVNTTDAKFQDREKKFREQLKNKYSYRIPLKYICDIGKINFSTKIDMKIHLKLKNYLNQTKVFKDH